MKRIQDIVLSVLLALFAASALAQTPARVRGTITAIDGNVLMVKSREGKDLRIDIAPDATYSYMKRLSLDDVKPGTPLGTSAITGPDGTQRVVVPADIPIVTSQAGDRSLLVVGEYAFIAATVAADGKMTAQRLQVSKDGVRPPQ